MSGLIVTHGDADGICSGAIAYSVFKDFHIVFSNPQDLPSILRKASNSFPKIIISDIAINSLEEFIDAVDGLSCEVTYLDHHPLPQKPDLSRLPVTFIHDENVCASELMFKHLREYLSQDMERVMLIGAVADYADDTPYVREVMDKWDRRTIYFEAGVLVNGLESFRKNDEGKEEILRFLSLGKPPSNHQGLVGAAIMNSFYEEEMRIRIKSSVRRIGEVSYVVDPKGPLGKAATYARSISGTIVGIAVSIEEKKADMSIRTASNHIDLNIIARKAASKCNGSGGGHRKAAGAKIPKDKLEEFLEYFSREVEEALASTNPRNNRLSPHPTITYNQH